MPAAIITLSALTMRRFDLRLQRLATTDEISATVREMVRLSDCLARWGGDEFAHLVESGGADARLLALRIQQRLADVLGDHPPATISVGIAEHRAKDTAESLLRRADQALYQSKQPGRDRITVAE